MYSKVHRPEKNELGVSNNAGSCVKLASYLDKETDKEKCYFSHQEDKVTLTNVIDKIDNNKKTLKNKQDKFYMLSYNPSHNEIAHLVYKTTGKKVNSLSELSPEDRTKVFCEFKNYVRECMDEYAKNFNREKPLTGKDLVYFGHIEEFRYYSYKDKEVQLGLKKKGDLKEGMNLHAHIIVSRMDVTQTISLSPLTKSTGNTNFLNGKEVKNGFYMQGWQIDCFDLFSNKYRYVIPYNDKFYYNNYSYSKAKSRIKNKVLSELMEDMKEERKTLSSVRNISLLANPSSNNVRLFLMTKIKNILSNNESVI